MSAVVDMTANTSRTLDRKAEPDEIVRESDIADVSRLARLLTRILSQLTELRRRFHPKRTTFINQPVEDTGTVLYRFPHRFGSAVNWWVVGWRDAVAAPALVEDTSDKGTDSDTLVLVSYAPGTVDICVEERG